MRLRFLTFLFLVFSAATSFAQAQEVPRIGFIFNTSASAPIGWSFEHERGRQIAQAYFGDRVQTDFFDNISEGEEGLAKMRTLADEGYDMIFVASFGYMNGAIQVAFENPELTIEHSGGYVRTKNMSTYSLRFYEGRVPQGILAGNMTRTNKVGYIASFPIPQVIRGINAAFLAARSVNPDVEFEVVWLNTWFNPTAEAEAARQLIANGADVIMQHTNSAAPMEVANEAGLFAFGQASDMIAYGPEAQLTASINNWGPYYIERIQAYLDGTWASEDRWGGLHDEMMTIGTFSDRIPLRIQEQAADSVARIRSGRLHPFTGPIRRQNGIGWLAAGETASDTDLLTMSFFVEGITAILP